MLSLASLSLALNIVSNGPALKKAPAMGASTVKMPVDHLQAIFKKLDANGVSCAFMGVFGMWACVAVCGRAWLEMGMYWLDDSD